MSNLISDQKRELRRQMRQLVRGLSADQKWRQSEDLTRELNERLQGIANDAVVMCYAALDDEVDVMATVRYLWRRGIKTVFPLVEGAIMHAYYIDDFERHMRPGYRDILEPTGATTRCDPQEVSVVLVPGMAFDRRGGRLGRGKGFYDKFLAQAPGVETIGCGFAHQEVEAVPREPHDQLLDAVIFASP